MKSYKNKIEHFIKLLEPPPQSERDSPKNNLLNVFYLDNQEKFNKYIDKFDFEVHGEINNDEERVLKNIKEEIKQLQKKYSDIKPERLEFDLAKIFHANLKQLGFGRFLVNDVGIWRWVSMQYFKEETFWRRGKADFQRNEFHKAAKATFEHCVGKRSRDIFPRRYFIIGQRLFDPNNKYELIDRLAEKSRSGRGGGFGNFISAIIEDKLISPNDHVSKIIAEVLFCGIKPGKDDHAKLAFVRYNAYSNRLLSSAAENIFKNEICLMDE